MPYINQLNAVSQINSGDLLALYSQNNGDARKVPLSQLAQFMAEQVAFVDDKLTQYKSPTTGSTVLVDDNQSSIWLIITPASTLAALTIRMPLVDNSLDKQELLVNCTQVITSLSFDANGGAVVGAPSTLSANGFFRLRFDAVMKTWYRVG